MCQTCKKMEDGDAGQLIGCEKCWRWYHYKCVGFKRKPSAKYVFFLFFLYGKKIVHDVFLLSGVFFFYDMDACLEFPHVQYVTIVII